MSCDFVDCVSHTELTPDVVHALSVGKCFGVRQTRAFDEAVVDASMNFVYLMAKSLAYLVVPVVTLGFAMKLHAKSWGIVHTRLHMNDSTFTRDGGGAGGGVLGGTAQCCRCTGPVGECVGGIDVDPLIVQLAVGDNGVVAAEHEPRKM